jgi:hypothetical protein
LPIHWLFDCYPFLLFYPSTGSYATLFFAHFLSWLLLLPGLGTSVKAQVVHRPEADSLLHVLAESRADTNHVKVFTNHVKVLLRLGEYQVYKPGEFKADMDSARTYALQAQSLRRTLGYYRGEAKSFNLLCTVSRESKDFSQAIAYQQVVLTSIGQHTQVKQVYGLAQQFIEMLNQRQPGKLDQWLKDCKATGI